jgi:hypothetical protein
MRVESGGGAAVGRGLVFVILAGSLCAGAVVPAAVEGQEIRGTVTATSSSEPLSGVRVWLQSSDRLDLSLAITSIDGSFRIRPDDPGEYHLRLTRIGYLEQETEQLTLTEGEVLELRLEMNLDPVRLPGVEVEVEALSAFEVHRATYTGLYMRRGDSRWATPGGNRVFVRADLEPHTGATVREFIERYAPASIQNQIRGERRYQREVIQAEMYGRRLPDRGRDCPLPSFFIRGVDVGDIQRGNDLAIIVEIYLDMPLREVEGIEFYRNSHHAPLELRPSSDVGAIAGACGVIVIWPRKAGESR